MVLPSGGWLLERLQEDELPHKVLNMRPTFRSSLQGVSELRKLLEADSVTESRILHAHGRLPLLLAGASTIRRRNLVLVTTVHQFAAAGRGGTLGWRHTLDRVAMARTLGVCCVSQALLREIAGLLPVGTAAHANATVIPNWIDKERLDDLRSLRPSVPDRQLAGIGRLVRAKGWDRLVRAVAKLRSRGHDVTASIYGAGPEYDALTKLTKSQGVSDLVEFRWPVGDVGSVLRRHQLLIVPSRTESFGYVALEGFAAGLPVLAHRTPGLQELVEGAGELVDCSSPVALGEAIVALLRDNAGQRRLRGEGFRRARLYTLTPEMEAAILAWYLRALALNG